MDDNKIKIQLEHYKLLRQEILQNSTEGIKALELGIILISALFTLSISQVIPDSGRWLFFLFPPIIVAPLIMLIAQRFRHTRKIGTHISMKIEPILDLKWESAHQKSSKEETDRITPRSLVAMSMPLMAVQCLSMIASLWYLLKFNNVFIIWLIWGLSLIFVGYLLKMEYRIIKDALEKDFKEEV
jgi:uncharacterized membrane protein